MEAKVDTGDIVAVKRFPVFENDTVYSITQRCYSEILYTFYEILYLLMNGENLPASTEKWLRLPYLRKELNELCRLTTDMDREEIESTPEIELILLIFNDIIALDIFSFWCF